MDQGTMTEQNDNLSNYDKVIETWRKKFLEAAGLEVVSIYG